VTAVAQLELDVLFRAMGAGVYATDLRGRVTVINDEALRLLGRAIEDISGRSIHDLVHYQDITGAPLAAEDCALLGVLRTGRVARSDDDYFWSPDGVPLRVAWLSAPVFDEEDVVSGAVVVFADAGDRTKDRARLLDQDSDRVAATERLTLLGRVSEALSTLDMDEALRRLARLSVGRLADWCIVDAVQSESVRRVAIAHRDPSVKPEGRYAGPLPPLTADAANPLARALREGRQQVITRATLGDVRTALDAEKAALFDQLGLEHALVTPLVARGEGLGAMTWVRLDPGDPFTEEEQQLAGHIARRAALSVENARLFGQQREVAASLQRSLLTVLPQPDDLEVAARYLPATDGAQVGGDWYDAFLGQDGAMAVVIGDIVGHDLQAVAHMGQVRNYLRSIAFDRAEEPAEVLRRLDVLLRGLQVDTLATCLFGRIEQTAEEGARGVRILRWCNAGHLPPLVVSPDGTARLLEHGSDLMLGVKPDTARDEHTAEVLPGDTIWLYTDGLVERTNESLDVGMARLRQVLSGLAALPLSQACDEVLARMLPDGHPDDVALLAVRAHPQKAQPPE
jgi:serine phosphatase RsbU (regulator of sigma subunit)